MPEGPHTPVGMSITRNRQPKGTPTGGQFAQTPRAISGLSLAGAIDETVRDAAERKRAHLAESVRLLREAIATRTLNRDAMARQYPHLDPDEFEFDLYAPARKALVEGRDEDAEYFLRQAHAIDRLEERALEAEHVAPANDEFGPVSIGVHYHPDITPSEIAGRLGLDIEDAAEAGYLPHGLAYRVGTATGADGREQVTVRAEGLSDELALTVVDDPLEERAVFAPSAYALKVGSRLSRLGNAYTRRHTGHRDISVFIDADVVSAGENSKAALGAHLRNARATGSAADVGHAQHLMAQGTEHTERTRAAIMTRHGHSAGF